MPLTKKQQRRHSEQAHERNGRKRSTSPPATKASGSRSRNAGRGPDLDFISPLQSPGKEETNAEGSRGSRVVGCFYSVHGASFVSEIAEYIKKYIVVSDRLSLVMALWVIAAWMREHWDRFPHLAITSPEKRCGKSWLLQLLEYVCPNAENMANVSPAAVYRMIKQKQPTLLLDEAQSLSRRGSEAAHVNREIFNASIDRNAKVIRCGGKKMDEVKEFPIYCPKVIALIGDLDGVLADRCLDIRLKRKKKGDKVARCITRKIMAEGDEIGQRLENWCAECDKSIKEIYDALEPFEIENDRTAELLLPLQAVLKFTHPDLMQELEQYALEMEGVDPSKASAGILLLHACREIFGEKTDFLSTENLIAALVQRDEEQWSNYSKGEAITDVALAQLLRPYNIRSDRVQKKVKGKNKNTRGYFRKSFVDAWERYCTP